MSLLTLASGMFVGFALGLTGGGGSIFAVPLLVYAVGVSPRESIGISLAAVGATALAGSLARLRSGDVEVGTGMIFAAAGMTAAPLGAWTGRYLPDTLLLGMFGALMVGIAVRMWRSANRRPEDAREVRAAIDSGAESGAGPSCRRDVRERLHLDSRCALVLVVAGLVTGYLAGLFGVGGGFVIVPALVLFTGMGIHRAVATSLLVIFLISLSGVASKLLAGESIDPAITAVFIAGGLLGMGLGTLLGRRLAGPALQKGFASSIIAVGLFVLARTWLAA